MFTLADVFEALTIDFPGGDNRDPLASFFISEATIDSRQVIPAAMFVALTGERTNGHEYIADALKHGASLALIQKDLSDKFHVIDLRKGKFPTNLPEFFMQRKEHTPFCLLVEDTLKSLQAIARLRRSKLNLRVIGITGSVGKSTTKEVLAGVLSQRYRTMKNPGNLNNEIGLPLTLLQLGEGHQRAVLEMGFYVPGEIAFLCDLAKPEIGVVTNIGTVHAERAGSQEAIAQGKTELVQSLPPAPKGVAILNFDDPLVRQMATKTKAQVLFYGLDPQAHIWADDIESHGLEGIRFRLHFNNENLHIRVPLIGRHSVHTVLRAVAVGLVDDLTWQEIIVGLQQSTTQLRMVAVHTDQGALLLDDTYNASPESVLAALNLLSEIPKSKKSGRKIAVLGDMLELGPYERAGHEMVGSRAASVCDKLVTVGERSKITAEAAVNAGLPPTAITSLLTIPKAIEFLNSFLLEGDIVLLKGGHSLRMDRITSALEKYSEAGLLPKVDSLC